MTRLRLAAIGLLLTLASACATTETAHQNFVNIMNYKVGTDADSLSNTIWRDPAARISLRTLPNGNIEEGYRQRQSCRYYFEIDSRTRKIVGWRYEGAFDECVVWP